MIHNGLKRFENKNILLLQGPIGPFFKRLSKKLKPVAKSIKKINFNGGDLFFYPQNADNYYGNLEDLKEYLKEYYQKHEIDFILMFNDCRPIHTIAKTVAYECNIRVGVFEEGYIRPDYVTFENDGVNAFSSTPKKRSFYENYCEISSIETVKIGNTFPLMARYAIMYWFFAFLCSPFFNNSIHHRSLNPFEFFPWWISAYRKYKYKIRERKNYETIEKFKNKYFLVPLQVYNDTQILTHYEKGNVETFIEGIIKSFANNSSGEDIVVFKHHPMDRGYKNYKNFILSLSIKYKLKGRVLYIHDGHLPTLLENAKGAIMINSTVGISAMHHKCPLKVCGDAFYDIEGLTYQGELDDFWSDAQDNKPDMELFKSFKNYIISKTQINGSFYKDVFLFE